MQSPLSSQNPQQPTEDPAALETGSEIIATRQRKMALVPQPSNEEPLFAEVEMAGDSSTVRATVVQASTVFYDTPATLGRLSVPFHLCNSCFKFLVWHLWFSFSLWWNWSIIFVFGGCCFDNGLFLFRVFHKRCFLVSWGYGNWWMKGFSAGDYVQWRLKLRDFQGTGHRICLLIILWWI